MLISLGRGWHLIRMQATEIAILGFFVWDFFLSFFLLFFFFSFFFFSSPNLPPVLFLKKPKQLLIKGGLVLKQTLVTAPILRVLIFNFQNDSQQAF